MRRVKRVAVDALSRISEGSGVQCVQSDKLQQLFEFTRWDETSSICATALGLVSYELRISAGICHIRL
ncbi:hypothetical protein CCR75_004634 [Bremia lactucae]|uniref:Uncharacterized protein n=1 Tax=Bremia lactucae TaxID=4779 RepID=A0A976FR47_BRELC|nr:hypothetical protein CCR75_004634 [Bremia lactucae]